MLILLGFQPTSSPKRTSTKLAVSLSEPTVQLNGASNTDALVGHLSCFGVTASLVGGRARVVLGG